MIYQPGFKAYEAGVSAATYAAAYLGEPYPKKRKTMAPRKTYQKKSNAKPRSMVTKTSRRSMGSKIKNTILQMAAPYHTSINDTVCGSAMTHNTIYTLNLTAFINQGTTNQNRTGDQIFLEAVKMRGYVRSATASNAYQYRILVGWSGEDITLVSLASVGGLSISELFLPSTGGASLASAPINPKAFTVLYDQIVDLNSQLTGTADINSVVATIRIQQKFAYQASASALGKTKNLFFVIVPSVPTGTVGVTDAGSCGFNHDIIFKNL